MSNTYSLTVSMDIPDEVFEWMIVWHRLADACEKCKKLANYPFYGYGDLPQFLIHPVYNAVWDLRNNEPLTHPNCRCTVIPYFKVNTSKIQEFVIFSETFDIPIMKEEWLSMSDIERYQNEIKGLRANFGAIKSDMREIEYMVQRGLSELGRIGIPGINIASRSLMGVREIQRGAMLESETLFGTAMATVSVVGGAAALTQMLIQWAQADTQAKIEAVHKEYETQLQAIQMEMRRKRW